MASRTRPSDDAGRSEALAAWLPGQRWFAGKSRRIAAVEREDTIGLGEALVLIVRVRLDDGSVDRYALPLAGQDDGDIRDAVDDPAFCRALLGLVGRGGRAGGDHGELRGHPTSAFPGDLPAQAEARRIGGEQSNTSVVFGRALILKLFRRLGEGVNPEQEVSAFLTERTDFRNAPRLAGSLAYVRPGAAPIALGVVHELVPGARDGWQWMLDALAEMYRRSGETTPEPARVRVAAADTLSGLRRLGEVTGGLHRALASHDDDPAFAPEAIAAADVAAWTDGVRRQLEQATAALGGTTPPVDLARVRQALDLLRGAAKTRHHGDLHLGQTLRRQEDGDWVIIDFEGEPLRSLAERRSKHTPLRDVAGMLRSIDYAAAASLRAAGIGDRIAAWAEAWEAEAEREFLAGYRASVSGAPFVPGAVEDFARVVAVFEVEKAAYEVVYEAGNRPDWMPIPRRGLARAAARLGQAATAGAA
jgi:maltose alpha-D-glucosyltransferase/alpha-amylase